MNNNNSLNLESMRNKLAGKSGQEYWRSLEELSETPGFREILEDEFPQQARPLRQAVDRRQFLMLAGASLGLAGLSGCRVLPQKKIVPYVEQPEDMVLGKPMYFASSIPLSGYATGVIVTSHDGRPTKIEGNNDHPASLGAADSFTQGTLLTMYDPDRSQNVQNLGNPSSWSAFLEQIRQNVTESGGKGLSILTETVTSPTLVDQIQRLLKQFPDAKWRQYEPINRSSAHEGTKIAFGEPANAVYHFSKAERILSLDADFMSATFPGNLRYARDFSDKRRLRTKDIKLAGEEGASSKIEHPKNLGMNRLYCLESNVSITGAAADHRLPVKASDIPALVQYLAAGMGIGSGGKLPASVSEPWAKALLKDLQANKEKSLVIAGDHQPPVVHALVAAMNEALGSEGQTLTYTAPIELNPVNQLESLKSLCDDMKAGTVKILLILGGNPVYTAPADLNFGSLLRQVRSSVHLSLFDDETSELCQWHLPDTHPLEAWSDSRAFDGVVSIVQPLIDPLYDGKSAHEVLSALIAPVGETDPKALGAVQNGYDILREFWSRPVNPSRDALVPNFANLSEKDFENKFQTVLHNGMFEKSAAPAKSVKCDTAKVAGTPVPAGSSPTTFDVVFLADPSIYDGRFVNNGWMQELPKPICKLTWDNAAIMSPADAIKLELSKENDIQRGNEKVVEIKVGSAVLRVPVLVQAGQPEGSITLTQGYGRTKAGKIGSHTGFNANLLRTISSPWVAMGATVTPTGATYELAHTREAHSMDAEAHTLIRVASLEDFNKDDKHLAVIANESKLTEIEIEEAEKNLTGEEKKLLEETKNPKVKESLYWKARETDHKYEGEGAYGWGMSIDNNVCIGCNACITACQSENNIAVVGKDQVRRGRDMLWLRIDTYYRGAVGNPGTFFEPVPCMQCELAPCEPVCPVAATVHSHEGLNMQVYNRCVGTKYCGNNCPYKVRRFNYYKYTAGQPEPEKMTSNYDSPVIKLSANPDVTIRGRGVMEKCTYCVQRINHSRIEAKKELRLVRDGEIQTACQQSCPTQAIVFGDIKNKESVVSQLKEEPHEFTLLADLNLRPRTTYLARVQNLNPEIQATVTEKKGA